MRQAVLRKTLEGDWTEFAFEKAGRFFFVKNFTDGDIFVSFEENTKEENCFKIASGVGEEVSISFEALDREEYKTKSVFVKGTGEVEVQGLDIYYKAPASTIEIDGNNLVVGNADTIDGNTLILGSKSEIDEHSLVI